MKTLKKLAIAAAVGGTLAAGATGAQASAQLSVWTGYGPVTVVSDNGAGDTNPAVGVVSWSGGTFPWVLNIDTGMSRPALGFTDSPKLRLDFTDTSYDIGEFTIMFTDTGFVGTGNLLLSAELTATTPGQVLYEVWADSNDNPFGLQQLVTSNGVGSPSGTAGSSETFNNPGGTYSLTQVVKIQHGVGANTTTGQAKAEVPAPASLALLGLGLAGLGVVRRRRG